jgi:excisionase family DNA binding protein
MNSVKTISIVEDASAMVDQLNTLRSQIAELQSMFNELAQIKSEHQSHPKTLSVKETAKLLQLSTSRIYVLHGLKLIPSHRIGSRVVFYRDEIMKLIDSGFKVTMQDEVNARQRMQEVRGVGVVGRKKAEAL